MWIEIHDNLPDHKKITDLAADLKADKDLVVGKIVRLWLWSLTNRPDGNFGANDVQTIAEKMRWSKGAQRLVDALVKNRLLDRTPDGYHIHDWEEHVISLLEKEDKRKQKTRERVANWRKRKGADQTPVDDENSNEPCNDDCNGYGNDDETASNAPTIPNHTNIVTCNQSIIPLQGEECEPDGMIERIRERFDYYWYEARPEESDAARMIELINVIFSVYASGGQASYSINGATLRGSQVIAIFDQLTVEHLEYVLETLDWKAPDVNNMRAYILTCLYNAPMQYHTDARNQAINMQRFRDQFAAKGAEQ